MKQTSVRRGCMDRAVDGVVDPAMFRGFYQGLGLAEGHRGLYRAQPVTKSPPHRVHLFHLLEWDISLLVYSYVEFHLEFVVHVMPLIWRFQGCVSA